jgi:NAD(P)-dependent dehydrogenase (short-subunit alcohol dehydrogenase family)
MRVKLKPLAEQIIVITGAGGGLGLAIAKRAAAAGASVLLTGLDETALRKAAEEINTSGGRAHAVAGDHADAEAVARVARAAIARFGGFDTWIAGPESHELGVANGLREAARHFKSRQGGGAVVSLAAGVSNALRREVRGGPLSLTEIRLPDISKLDGAVEVVAAAALYGASHALGRMAVSSNGRRLSFATEAQKHRGLLLGVGLVGIAVVAAWYGRNTIGAAVAPAVKKTVRPLVVEAARRRPLTAAKLVARHPRQAFRFAAALR